MTPCHPRGPTASATTDGRNSLPLDACRLVRSAVVSGRGPRRAIQAQLRSSLTTPEIRIEEGDARDAIPRVAGALEADLIVLGTHGRTGIVRLAIGSVAQQMLHTSNIPVMTAGPKDRGNPLSHIAAG